ncbi:MAG: hypothetical protein HC898_03075 [Phycisphaerales bacterium]|nr:hypothetical protein [Phycisphaerales bacterium]
MFERLGSITYANRMDGWFDFNDDDTVDFTNTDFYSVPGVFAAPGVPLAAPSPLRLLTSTLTQNIFAPATWCWTISA